ncbi:GNAT family N-acetyltransferase [Agarivorans aestuarii]|uniref:GNAT family N-acetyltransferase n=1 Tax=Agarivorans aestuarii TaxID=1563703 RepID=A0ABU7G2G6_9ALTE|nr:GNAT family N-acetyltransferase [Agarivorans aestuarii]MEE1673516.1 GNAT family N-acetyltransferase [Agarivorans aestuarii]
MNTHKLCQQAFFNSLLAETANKHLEGESVFLPLSTQASLELKLSYVSPSWRHHYSGEIVLHEQQQQTSVSFQQAAQHVVNALYPELSEDKKALFLQRVQDSNHYIARAEQALSERSSLNLDQFITSEQSLTGGHSMHPAGKSCEPLSELEQQQYLPEFAGQFSIEWFAVHSSHLAGESEVGELSDKLKQLYSNSVKISDKPSDIQFIDKQWVPFPMHPLQAKAWRESQQALSLNEVVKDLALSSPGWTATSSSRAIYHPQQAWMLKVSLPVKLTNSLRLLSSKEAKRGIQFSQLLNSEKGAELRQRIATSYFIEEPLWASIIDIDGETLDLPLISFRENPFHKSNQERSQLNAANLYCLASVNQIVAEQSESKIVSWIKHYAQQQQLCFEHAARQWMSAFWDKVIKPLCIARADYGFVLLAHQQNILLRVENNLPTGSAFRDCQGIGLTSQALSLFKQELGETAPEYFMEAEQVNPYHAYYLIGNTLLNTIAAIGAGGLISETKLWDLYRDKISELSARNPQDQSFYQYLLNSPSLHWKRNFYCFLADHNEATLAVPSQIYCSIANPLKQSKPQVLSFKTLAGGRTLCFADEQISNNAIKFEVREHGESLSRGLIEKIGDWCQLSFEEDHAELNAKHKTDDLLWWSAAEHGFFQLKVEALQSDYYPTTAKGLVAESPYKALSLAQFLQTAPLWREPQATETEQALVEASNGISHPSRPIKPIGQVFTRYFYHLKRQVTFRVIDKQRDIGCFNRWHNHPLISPVWELEGDLQSHVDYLSKMEKDPHQYAVIGEFDGVPFGYFEVYWTPEDRLGPHYQCQDYDRGVHILVGNFSFRGGVYFDTWGSAILQYCFLDEAKTQRVMGEPRADNHRVVSITERLGLEKQFEFDFPHKRAALLQCDRQRFFTQYAI